MKKKDKTHYEILGLQTDASVSDIKRAYRKIAKSMHPDLGHQLKTEEERVRATEEMLQVNVAHEILIDKKKRASYDLLIGVTIVLKQPFQFARNTEDEAREFYLAKIFNPSRSAISRILHKCNKQIMDLSADPFDDELIQTFEEYLDEVEAALLKASNLFSSLPEPSSLVQAVLTMRLCIAQVSDALEEMRRFSRNYNFDHLSMGMSLFGIANDLSRKAADLTRIV